LHGSARDGVRLPGRGLLKIIKKNRRLAMEITLGTVFKGCLSVLLAYGTFSLIRDSIANEVEASRDRARKELLNNLYDDDQLRAHLLRELRQARKGGDV